MEKKRNWPRRRKMREAILMTLYAIEPSDPEALSQLQDHMHFVAEEETQIDQSLRVEATRFAESILAQILPIDAAIQKHLVNWSWERVAMVDRTILRMGVYEILFEDTIPIEVTINEAVEIAKKYGSEKSSSFVNGILNSVAQHDASKEKWILSPEKIRGGGIHVK